MKFTLVYWDTQLKAASHGSKRNWEKHSLRRYFSSQLETLWHISSNLRSFDRNGDIRQALAKKYKRGGIGFIPIVSETLGLVCDLEILLLRPGTPGRIISESGDIDNRIKVLFDALRVPKDESEMPLKNSEVSPNPIFCVMDDDKLVTSMKVTTDQLLVRTAPGHDSEACVTIHVTVKSIHPETPYELRD